jgi:hypothetical protein
MTAIQAASVNFKGMADGTLRLWVDFEPADRDAAFKAFCSPGTPLAIARLKTAPELAASEAKKGGALSKLAGQWCATSEFQNFMKEHFPGCHGGSGSSAEDRAAQGVRLVCGISSRAELDHNETARHLFNSHIRLPFQAVLESPPNT